MSDVPVVHFTLQDGTNVYALVDTGSEMTLFDRKFVEQHKESFGIVQTADKVNLIGLSAKRAFHVVSVSTVLHAEEDELALPVFDAMLFDLAHLTDTLRKNSGWEEDKAIVLVLGADILKNIDAKINFKNKTLSWR